MIWLGIDTSNAPLSVALVQDGKTLAEIVQNVKLTHSVGAMAAVEEVFKKAKLQPNMVDAIAVAEGPGSYTGVRIGVTIAKTLAWTLKKPLVGVSSLKVLAASGSYFDGAVCALFDARRQNVFGGVFTGEKMEPVIADTHASIEELLVQLKAVDKRILFVGTDVALFWDKIVETLGDQAVRAKGSDDLPRASNLIDLATNMELPPVKDTHHFVPQYRKIAEAEQNWINEQKQVGQ